jgi:hypothetical protein
MRKLPLVALQLLTITWIGVLVFVPLNYRMSLGQQEGIRSLFRDGGANATPLLIAIAGFFIVARLLLHLHYRFSLCDEWHRKFTEKHYWPLFWIPSLTAPFFVPMLVFMPDLQWSLESAFFTGLFGIGNICVVCLLCSFYIKLWTGRLQEYGCRCQSIPQ